MTPEQSRTKLAAETAADLLKTTIWGAIRTAVTQGLSIDGAFDAAHDAVADPFLARIGNVRLFESFKDPTAFLVAQSTAFQLFIPHHSSDVKAFDIGGYQARPCDRNYVAGERDESGSWTARESFFPVGDLKEVIRLCEKTLGFVEGVEMRIGTLLFDLLEKKFTASELSVVIGTFKDDASKAVMGLSFPISDCSERVMLSFALNRTGCEVIAHKLEQDPAQLFTLLANLSPDLPGQLKTQFDHARVQRLEVESVAG